MVGIRLMDTSSPITAETVALAGVTFSELRSHGDNVYVLVRDPNNSGKTYIQRINNEKKEKQVVSATATATATTPTPLTIVVGGDFNVRSAVHEYGGGAYCVFHGGIIFTDFPSHILYYQPKDESTARVLLKREHCRFADFMVHAGTQTMYAIMEDHTQPEPSKVVNSIVAISLASICNKNNQPTVKTVAHGHDFYACPQISPNGKRLSYIAWDHPNMPWDTTMLYLQTIQQQADNDTVECLGPPEQITSPTQDGEPCSMAEARWHDDCCLYFLSDATGWYSLYKYFIPDRTTTCVVSKSTDFLTSGWVLGQSPYVVLPEGNLLATTALDGILSITQTDNGMYEANGLSASCTAIESLCTTLSGDLYYIGGSTTEPKGIWNCSYPTCKHELVVSSIPDSTLWKPLKSLFSEPQPVTFPSPIVNKDGNNKGTDAPTRMSHGFYYPPTAITDTTQAPLPPLLVKAHGGPTSQTSNTFRLDIQYWTTRGFAVLDVDYGGSSGYGKDYRNLLNGKWGIVDVEDVCAGAMYCVQQGWCNEKWLAIDGRSAGGYTTLAALTFSNVFQAGASFYGIADLVTLYHDTHKFESRYMDRLIGTLPEDEAIYKERCPVHYTNQLNCPVILLQGDQDKVVPPNQAETMFSVLQEKGLDTALIIYKGEQHGFRKGTNICHALNSEYSFFCQVFGIDAMKEPGMEQVTIGTRIEV